MTTIFMWLGRPLPSMRKNPFVRSSRGYASQSFLSTILTKWQ
ncbi:hypothetical protein LINPERHAP2_LOCUS4350 [Linum perenne]